MSSALKRRLFFLLFVFLFLITAPIIILYSTGYRFNLERNIFIHSGSVTVKPIPQKVDIFIDNKPVSSNKINFLNYTYHLDGIRPGEHIIEIRKEDYQPWSKKTVVQSGLSAEFWNIFLAQKNYTKNKLGENNTNNFFVSPKDNRAALVDNTNDQLKISILDIDDNAIEYSHIFENYSLSSNIEKENIEWSPQGDKLIIPVMQNESQEKDYIITDIEFKDYFMLTKVTQKAEVGNARWDPLYKNYIFFLSDNNLFRIDLDIDSKSTAKSIAEDISGFDLSKSGVYYLNSSNGIIHRKSLTGENKEQITTKPIKNIVSKNLRLIAYDEERVAVINGDETLYLFNEGDKETYMNKFPGKVKGIHFSNDGKKMLYWTDREIFVHFLRYWDTQPIRKENETRSITRFSQKISNVHWHEDYEHIIFSTGNKIKITEIDHRSYRNTMDLTKINANETKIVSNFSENWLLFLDKKNEAPGLYYINLEEMKDE